MGAVKNQYGEKNSNWKGGKSIRSGYIYILYRNHPNCNSTGYVAEHRLIMEKYLGRYLTKKERIHHINHNCIDNRIENLKLFKSTGRHTASEHMTKESQFRLRDSKGRFIPF